MYTAVIEQTEGIGKGEWYAHSYASKSSFLNDWNGTKCKVVIDSEEVHLSVPEAVKLAEDHHDELVRKRWGIKYLSEVLS